MSGDRGLSFKTSMEFAYGTPAPMSPGVVRIVARNPGPFTYKGTNTYLAGSTSLAVIDPGPDDAEHRAAILAAAAGRPITHIFITHAHRDHIDGADRLRAETGAIACAYERLPPEPGSVLASPSGKEFVNYEFVPDQLLTDGEVVAGTDWEIEAIHTPGHAPDHLSFALRGRQIVFSGDHVMAWNTSVIAPPEGRMSDYMASLDRLVVRNDRLFLPGHGERIPEPVRMVRAYIVHRRVREQQILDTVKRGASSIDQITKAVYRGIDASVFGAACLSTLAHIEHLIERGLISSNGPPTLKGTFHPLST